MTKLDVNLSGKKTETENDGTTVEKQADETQTLRNDTEPATLPVDGESVTPAIMIGEIEITTTAESCDKKSPNTADQQLVTFDWRTIKRIAISQMVLSLMAMTCVVVSVISMGVTCYKFSQFIMSLYLLFTGYSGLKGSNKSYKHLIVYLIMTALQWMINIIILGCLTYAVYDTPYYAYNIRYALRSIDYEEYGIGIGLLIMEVITSATMMGTVITGMLGLTACCKGFGRLLGYQEMVLQSRHDWVEQA